MAYTGLMNLDILKHIFDVLKLAPKYLVAISMVLGFLLFAPTEVMQWFGVADVAKDYRQWLGVGFLAITTLLVVSVVQGAYALVRNWIGKLRFKRKLRKRLARLTEDEKQILRFYIAKQSRSNTLRVTDGVVQALAGAGIIYRAATMGNMVEGFAYNINEIAWNVLNEDLALLDGTTDTYRTDKRTHWMQ